MADRIETKKSIRIIEKQQKNMFDIITFLINAHGKDLPVPSALLHEIGKHSMLYSSNALANHIAMINSANQKMQSDMDL
jgi:3-deoxy-D-arabino-heptulosonate 7-phosphate (DAHP) synthase